MGPWREALLLTPRVANVSSVSRSVVTWSSSIADTFVFAEVARQSRLPRGLSSVQSVVAVWRPWWGWRQVDLVDEVGKALFVSSHDACRLFEFHGTGAN
mmetsp:Transcript_9424/g.26253  ORF Transcript_9424/g.26253 Transcript_9424/m.26253 type:complete len:99 (-) Transcript_9424:350-646(-)